MMVELTKTEYRELVEKARLYDVFCEAYSVSLTKNFLNCDLMKALLKNGGKRDAE